MNSVPTGAVRRVGSHIQGGKGPSGKGQPKVLLTLKCWHLTESLLTKAMSLVACCWATRKVIWRTYVFLACWGGGIQGWKYSWGMAQFCTGGIYSGGKRVWRSRALMGGGARGEGAPELKFCKGTLCVLNLTGVVCCVKGQHTGRVFTKVLLRLKWYGGIVTRYNPGERRRRMTYASLPTPAHLSPRRDASYDHHKVDALDPKPLQHILSSQMQEIHCARHLLLNLELFYFRFQKVLLTIPQPHVTTLRIESGYFQMTLFVGRRHRAQGCFLAAPRVLFRFDHE